MCGVLFVCVVRCCECVVWLCGGVCCEYGCWKRLDCGFCLELSRLCYVREV